VKAVFVIFGVQSLTCINMSTDQPTKNIESIEQFLQDPANTQIQRQVLAAVLAEHPEFARTFEAKSQKDLEWFFDDTYSPANTPCITDGVYQVPSSEGGTKFILEDLIHRLFLQLKNVGLEAENAGAALPFFSQVMFDEMAKIVEYKAEKEDLSPVELNKWIYENVIKPRLAGHPDGEALMTSIETCIEQGFKFGNYVFERLDHILASLQKHAKDKFQSMAKTQDHRMRVARAALEHAGISRN
jgi:hypothetical protein